MKRKFFVLAALAGALMISCNEDEIAPVKGVISVDKSEIILENGLAGHADLTVSAENVDPEVSVETAAENWLVALLSGTDLRISYSQNDSGNERTGKVEISGTNSESVIITVTQPAYVAPAKTYSIGNKTEDGLGIIYWVNPDDATNAKAVSIQRTTGLAWSVSSDLAPGAYSYVNGQANTDAMLSSQDSTSYPAAAWCRSLGSDWYLPARNEVFDIFDVYNGVAHDDPSFVSAIPDNLTAAEKSAREKFDKMLTDAGATQAFNTSASSATGDAYWTSTEENGNAYYVKVGQFSYSLGGVKKTSTSRIIRCVRTVGNHTFPGEPAMISVASTSVTFEGSASDTTVIISVKNGTASASVSSEASSWCSVSVSDNDVRISVSANETGEIREATVCVTAVPTSSGAESASVNIAIVQTPKGLESFKLNDLYSEGGKVVGVVFWVSTDGLSAKVISLDRLSTKWSEATTTSLIVNPTNDDDGKPNFEIIKNCAEASSMPAVKFITDKGDGWYWPALRELQALHAAYNGVSEYSKVSTALPNALPEAERNARAVFDKLLTDNGGTALNTMADDKGGDSYFSSSEKDASQAKYVRFGSKSTANSSKGSIRYVRAVKLISRTAN